ncbi:MAG: hypothetical protein GY772_19380 [bacterium]|nr:hypothetical protein [bacterium]
MRVVALTHVAAGALRMAPLLVARRNLVTSCATPYSLQVAVPLEGGHSVGLHIVASPNLPKPLLPSATPSVEGHAWKPCNFPWPFWAVRRSDDPAQCNCVLRGVTVNSVSTFGLGRAVDGEGAPSGTAVSPSELVIEMMTNDRDIEKDEELVVFWPPRATPAKPVTTPKARTWREQLRGAKGMARPGS